MKINRPEKPKPIENLTEPEANEKRTITGNILNSNDKFEYETICIIKRIKSGESLAFNELIERYKRQVAAIVTDTLSNLCSQLTCRC